MKNIVALVLLLTLLAGAGCSQKYVITTSNGMRITTSSKPKLKQGVYLFKDAEGRASYVTEGRVREIAPASMVEKEGDRFRPPTSKQ